MSPEKDPYYDREEVSNSDLSEIAKYWLPADLIYDIDAAYRFGSLLDCMVTEPDKVNYYKLTCAGYQFSKEEFDKAAAMKAAFWRDPFCKMLAENSKCQLVSIRHDFAIEFDGFSFTLPVRCKWDFNAMETIGMTGDLKSTTAKTEKEFLAACHHFGYFRQRAWYMDIGDSVKDMLIGVSKVNHKVFKIPITRGSEVYNIGKAQYQQLAFKYAYLFGDVSTIRRMEPIKQAA